MNVQAMGSLTMCQFIEGTVCLCFINSVAFSVLSVGLKAIKCLHLAHLQ